MSDMTPEQAQALLDGIAYGDATLQASMLTARGLNAIEAAAPDLARTVIAQAAELTRLRAVETAADKLAEALRSKTVMDPDNSNSTWLDAQARAALSTYREVKGHE